MPIPLIHKRDLGVAEVRIDRVGITRAAPVSNSLESFADIGDSGGPVIRNGQLVGILNNLDLRINK